MPTSWNRLQRLMDHTENRMKDKISWNRSIATVKYIQHDLGLADLFTEDDIQKCIGIVNVNGIKSKVLLPKMQEEDGNGRQIQAGYFRCIYPTMALLSNSCECNARCIHHNDFGRIVGNIFIIND